MPRFPRPAAAVARADAGAMPVRRKGGGAKPAKGFRRNEGGTALALP